MRTDAGNDSGNLAQEAQRELDRRREYFDRTNPSPCRCDGSCGLIGHGVLSVSLVEQIARSVEALRWQHPDNSSFLGGLDVAARVVREFASPIVRCACGAKRRLGQPCPADGHASWTAREAEERAWEEANAIPEGLAHFGPDGTIVVPLHPEERVAGGLPESAWADEERAAGLDYDDLDLSGDADG